MATIESLEESLKSISESLTHPPGSRERCYEFIRRILSGKNSRDWVKKLNL